MINWYFKKLFELFIAHICEELKCIGINLVMKRHNVEFLEKGNSITKPEAIMLSKSPGDWILLKSKLRIQRDSSKNKAEVTIAVPG